MLGRLAVVVEGVAGEGFRLRGVEGDVEEVGAVTVGAEHVGGDEAGAGVVALVAENAVELQRVADRLVNLQDHLVGRQQHVHAAGRAVGRQKQLDGFLGNLRRGLAEAELVENFEAALPAIAAPAEAARLRFRAVVGGGAERGHQGAERLLHAAAVGRQVEGVNVGVPQRGVPIDDARVDPEAGAFALQQVDLVGQRDVLPRLDLRANVFAPGRLHDDLREVHHAVGGALSCPLARLVNRLAQAAGTEVAGGGVAHAAAVPHGEHGAAVRRADHRLQHVLPHRQHLGALADQAQGAEIHRRDGLAEVGFDGIGHFTSPLRRRVRLVRPCNAGVDFGQLTQHLEPEIIVACKHGPEQSPRPPPKVPRPFLPATSSGP